MFKRLFGGKSGGRSEASAAPLAPVSVALAHIGGTPELDFLLISPAEDDIVRALDGWHWIGLAGLTAIAVSAFGEVFFQDANGSILQLDTIEGKKRIVAGSLAEFTANLLEADRRDDLLLAGLIIGARNAGMLLSPGECYDFRVAPVLGGAMDVEHIEKLAFVVKLHIAGQLHEQVKDLPPGTRIDSVSISD
ncbi:MAG: T6SS immunity protein Tdi1 domain-containing protein [Sphingomonas sp.]